MRRKAVIAGLLVTLLATVFIAWRLYLHYVPLNLESALASIQSIHEGGSHHNERYGFEFDFPKSYYPCMIGPVAVTLRQNTASMEECKTVGKRIEVQAFQLGTFMGIAIGYRVVKLAKDTTLDDISRQFQQDDNRPWVHRACLQNRINDNDAMICTMRAPGEMPSVNGDIFAVFIFGIHETTRGERVLVKVSNAAGGTPYAGDRQLQRDTLAIFNSLRWSHPAGDK